MADAFSTWLGKADDDIRQVVAAEQLKGKSVSDILKELIRRGMNKRDDRIEVLLEQQSEMLGRIEKHLLEAKDE